MGGGEAVTARSYTRRARIALTSDEPSSKGAGGTQPLLSTDSPSQIHVSAIFSGIGTGFDDGAKRSYPGGRSAGVVQVNGDEPSFADRRAAVIVAPA